MKIRTEEKMEKINCETTMKSISTTPQRNTIKTHRKSSNYYHYYYHHYYYYYYCIASHKNKSTIKILLLSLSSSLLFLLLPLFLTNIRYIPQTTDTDERITQKKMYKNRKRGTVIMKLYNQNNIPIHQQNKSNDTIIATPKMKRAYKIHQIQKYQNPKNEILNQNTMIFKYYNKHQRIEQYILIYIRKTINTENINKSHALLPSHNISPRNQHWPGKNQPATNKI